MMNEKLKRVRVLLDEAEAFVRTYRFEMTDDYRSLVERVEALPRNQPGTEKGGRWLGSLARKRAQLRLVRAVE